MTSYVRLRRQLKASRQYEPGEQVWADCVALFILGCRQCRELPSVAQHFDWLELLEVAGHRALVFKDLLNASQAIGGGTFTLSAAGSAPAPARSL